MEFSEVIERRYAVRGYKPDKISQEQLNYILNAARLAPTAANRQPFKIIVINPEGKREQLRKIYDRDWFVNAPLHLCVVAIPEQAWVRGDGMNFAPIDVAIVMDHMVLAATDLGLGTCWVAAFDVNELKRFLNLPQGVEPLVMTPLGYPAIPRGEKERKPIEDLVSYNTW